MLAELTLARFIHPFVVTETTAAEGIAENFSKQFLGIHLRLVIFVATEIALLSTTCGASARALIRSLTCTELITGHTVGIVSLSFGLIAEHLRRDRCSSLNPLFEKRFIYFVGFGHFLKLLGCCGILLLCGVGMVLFG